MKDEKGSESDMTYLAKNRWHQIPQITLRYLRAGLTQVLIVRSRFRTTGDCNEVCDK